MDNYESTPNNTLNALLAVAEKVAFETELTIRDAHAKLINCDIKYVGTIQAKEESEAQPTFLMRLDALKGAIDRIETESFELIQEIGMINDRPEPTKALENPVFNTFDRMVTQLCGTQVRLTTTKNMLTSEESGDEGIFAGLSEGTPIIKTLETIIDYTENCLMLAQYICKIIGTAEN